MAKVKMSTRKGRSYKGSKPKKVKGSGKSSLKAVLDKWGKKYDILK